ncbi:hypothetical protein GPECTOR_9g531 [Gonium pectorale]|uniref:Uncharacterized protein n=1 Tax=Gonium pectorale TaxID=33097 RepID=A0A150GRP7_GONPE|nr:hypothetical protein GPECTOR_9g531 [Gonium pectorale]|eukprot:KXZ52487.1 hypothetical protein GPECTOR_9g531 [Gonium pectorale]
MVATLIKRFLLAGLIALLCVASFEPVAAGLFGYGVCQTGCNTLAGACYAAGGATFGTVTAGGGTPATITGCNPALGACMKSCVAAGLNPFG